jgi:type VI secretion system secreted protein Hcp
MAQTVHLRLQIDGNDIEGESTVASMDRENTIECSSFFYEITTDRNSDGRLTGKRQHKPVKISKRIDKTTPLLLKALCRNERVNDAEFMFFRPSLGNSRTEEKFYTVLLRNGYISGVKQLSEDPITGGEDAPPMMEEVEFVFREIIWTYESSGTTHSDRLGD